MLNIILWTLVYSIATAISIVLLGQRDLISGNLLEIKRLLLLLANWKFIVSMVFALIARVAFIMTNNSLLKIPSLANSSTTITTFITLFCLILVVVANIIFLKEKINISQGVGATLIMIGVWVMLK
jgi:drug/metabolite transporter (DMT)-like permease